MSQAPRVAIIHVESCGLCPYGTWPVVTFPDDEGDVQCDKLGRWVSAEGIEDDCPLPVQTNQPTEGTNQC
jgi:hypothetical protein